MPVERRYIIFSEGEVLQALRVYSRTEAPGSLKGYLKGIEHVQKDGVVVSSVVTVQAGNFSLSQKRVFAQDMVKILAQCCIENNIPIPLRGEKKVVWKENALALSIWIDPEKV